MSEWPDSELGRQLLRAGRQDLPPVENCRRVEKALGFFPGELLVHASTETLTAAAELTASGATTSAATGTAGVSAKLVWVGALTLATLGGAAGGYWAGSQTTAPESPAAPPLEPPASVEQPSPAPPVLAPSEPAAEPAEPAATPVSPTPTPPRAESPRAKPASPEAPSVQPRSTTLEEVRALDQVRRDLASGQGQLALQKLNAYRTRFPRGVLGPEATFLRVQALLAAGDRAGAERLGRRVLAQSSGSVHAARIRKLLGLTDEAD